MDNIILDILQRLSNDGIKVISYHRYHDGIAVAAKDRKIAIYWFDLLGKQVFKIKSGVAHNFDIEYDNEDSIHLQRINEWLKVYSDKGRAYKILVEQRNYLMPLGSVYDIFHQRYDDILSHIEVKENILTYRNKILDFKYPIKDIVYFEYPQRGFLVLANCNSDDHITINQVIESDGWPKASYDCLTLYAHCENGELLWKLPDYSKKLHLPRTEPINHIDINDDKIVTSTGTWILHLDSSDGKAVHIEAYR